MARNWQLADWPNFNYNTDLVSKKERQFLLGSGNAFAFLKNVNEDDRNQFIVEILSLEGLESSRIEGEILDRQSLQSSIKKQFGLKDGKREGKREAGMAELLCDVFRTFEEPLTHEMLYGWHRMLFKEHSQLSEVGGYRTHVEPMQIVSGRLDRPQVFFEAPPSKEIHRHMTHFIDWFNHKSAKEPILGRASIAHVYFESIHPFEDGNGRIGRILVEKVLSQGIGQPTLIAVSKFIEKQKKAYYTELGKCNKTLEVSSWVEFFSEKILEAQDGSMNLLYHLIEKSRLLTFLAGKINSRQEKVLLRMFAEGVDGFAGGLSAENYIAITKATRATTTRDLADLVEKGALFKTGELRHTRYWLNIEHYKRSG